jgi:GPH family glycoside/pentoside/hexuronide:cation symporter
LFTAQSVVDDAQLKFKQKVLYASGEFSQFGIENLILLFMYWYLTKLVGFGSSVAGAVLVGGIIWDAISDPIMGWISDKYYLLLKGRHRFVLAGAVLSGILIGLMFTSHFWLYKNPFLYLLLYMALNTGLTIFGVPFMTLPGDFLFSSQLRTNMFAWRFVFANLGSLVASVMVAVLQGLEPNSDTFFVLVVVFAAVNLCIGLGAGVGTRRIEESFALKNQSHVPGWRAIISAFKNKAFLPMLLGYLLVQIGVGMSSAMALYFYKDHLQITETQTGTILVVFFMVITVSVVGWVKSSERFGKLGPLQIGSFVLGAGTCIVYPLLPVGNYIYPLMFGGVILGSFVGCVVLLQSLLTDVTDYGELKFGTATTAVYFGIWKFNTKLARAIAFGLTGLVLDGGLNAAGEPIIATERLPWLFGPGVGSFILTASLLMGLYKFTDKKQKQVARILRLKRR